jgi:molybdopterin molybdotransferase
VIDLDEALRRIERACSPLPPRRQRLAEAAGRRLAEPVVADVDSPPWHRAMMDGFAVCGSDFEHAGDGVVELAIVGELAAGEVPTVTVSPGACVRIMTGAPVPEGADAVVPIESAVDGTATARAGSRVRLRDGRFRPGQHVGRRGTAFTADSVVLPAGTPLSPAAIGLAAEAGATHVVAIPRVRVAILSTGSELVEPAALPAFGQTRNSNGPMLAASVAALDCEPITMGAVADRPEPLRAAVSQALAADVVVLSGGVSAGDLDLVPGILARCGVAEIFHKVRLKPGKPVWFGSLARADAAPTLVFGLPGNPASSFVCFELFVRPALRALAGAPPRARHLPRSPAVLAGPVGPAGDRPVFLPCRFETPVFPSGIRAAPLPWTGSSDLVGLAVADGLIHLPAGSGPLAAGQTVEVVLLHEADPTRPQAESSRR